MYVGSADNNKALKTIIYISNCSEALRFSDKHFLNKADCKKSC